MKIHLLSDLHLETEPIRIKPLPDADLVVLAGDIGVGTAGVEWAIETFMDQPVLYVPGNHEYYFGQVESVLAAMRKVAAGSNVSILEKDCYEFQGVRFLGSTLWTDFRLLANGDDHEHAWSKVEACRSIPDFDGRIRCQGVTEEMEVTPDVTQRWFGESVAWLLRELGVKTAQPTVVITHHAPSIKSIASEYVEKLGSSAFASNLEELTPHVALWMHGHTHVCSDYKIGNCRVVSNPRGYGNEAPEFDRDLLIHLP